MLDEVGDDLLCVSVLRDSKRQRSPSWSLMGGGCGVSSGEQQQTEGRSPYCKPQETGQKQVIELRYQGRRM